MPRSKTGSILVIIYLLIMICGVVLFKIGYGCEAIEEQWTGIFNPHPCNQLFGSFALIHMQIFALEYLHIKDQGVNSTIIFGIVTNTILLYFLGKALGWFFGGKIKDWLFGRGSK